MKKLVALIFCAFFLLNITPSFAQTGTCECDLNGGTRMWYLKDNFCGPNEHPSGCEGSAIANPIRPNCICKPVPTSPSLPTNSCICNSMGVVTTGNCQGSTPTAYCAAVYGGYFDCSCGPATGIPTSPPFDLKDCACNTSTDNGSKTCKPAQGTKCAQGKVAVCQLNPDGGCNHALFGGGACVCKEPGAVTPTTNEDGNFCTQQGFGALTSDPRVDTALGCIPVKMDKFIAWLLPVLFSISGGIAFLLMVYGFILITTSKGDPKAVQGAKETITSAIIGLLISIFAIFILRLITVGILKIPGIS